MADQDIDRRQAAGRGVALPAQAFGAAATTLVSALIGEIAVVFSRSPGHNHLTFADLTWLVMPPVLAGQAYVAEARHSETGARAPVAAVLWARVSPDVDARLTAAAGSRPRLAPDDWTSGDRLWIIDVAGPLPAAARAIQALYAGPFKDREVRVVARDAAGAAHVTTLAALLRSAGNNNGSAA